ncbi:serine/threonine-protein kinase psk1 [Pseudomassariella vexata]|uniref:Serine/threonine-protein kinase psk1 n=1 Tax=Pseudomassariella vexata TaxID=1141098 RepID=A0A1Y2DSB1_9PEZI|nr:serine/threonine-protein kinase psk1 [Pseudomassariella vexata]ORY62163.1 serine/threonine-protein kinase psk1 [Pseudomassariella vexata]
MTDSNSNTKSDPPAPLQSSFQVLSSAGESFASVRVQNLQGTISVGRDAWGRANKLQPALISTCVSFAQPFGTASSGDVVNAETAHYGNLSKNLLSTLNLFDASSPPKDPNVVGKAETEGPSSADVFELLWVGLTGRVVDGSQRVLPLDQVPFLDTGKLRSLELTVLLPKASLLGEGCSLTVTACFKEGADGNPLKAYARSIRIHGLRVPTLIGVNANERKAKQMVLADVVIDKLDVTRDIHPEVERMVVDAMEASSFETLEALAVHIGNKILSDFRIGDDPKPARERGWQVKISLSKPIAVPLAECPTIEIKMGADLP